MQKYEVRDQNIVLLILYFIHSFNTIYFCFTRVIFLLFLMPSESFVEYREC